MVDRETVARLHDALSLWPDLQIAVLFGSMAHGQGTWNSDLDVAVQMGKPLSSDQKIALIDHLAGVFARPIDVIDLREVGQPLLDEIVSKGVMVKGGAAEKGDLLFKSIMMQEDFGHYQQRILEGRRNRWIEL